MFQYPALLGVEETEIREVVILGAPSCFTLVGYPVSGQR